MSKTTIILLIVAAISLIILLAVYAIFGWPADDNAPIISNATVISSDESAANKVVNQETATTNSSANIADNSDTDKVVDSFVLDQNQESADFDSETSDKSQIQVESNDLLNLSQSYETNDF